MNQNQIPNGNPQTSKDGVKSLFSCLGGENSQSINSINDNNDQNPQPSTSNTQRSTGAIPKLKTKQTNKVSPKPVASSPPVANNDDKNFSKSSLQYLVMNKWLPLPLGSDYKLIDFNFMFSRNCSNGVAPDGVVQFNGQAEMVESSVYQPPREYPMMNNGHYPRVIRNVTPQLSRLRESDAENVQYENAQREMYRKENFRARSESPSFNGQRQQQDPFRNWSFNFENNSFRPAGAVRRITDGTLAPKDYQEQNPRKELPTVFIEPENNIQEQPTTSKSVSPSSENSNQSASCSSSSGTVGKTSEMKKSENYDNLASLQHDPLPSTSDGAKSHKKKSTESSDSVTLAEEDEDNEDPFDELESDID
jgi:kelch-like protein 2/3